MLAVCATLALSIPNEISFSELSKARLHFKKVFEPDPKYKGEDEVEDIGELYKVRELFPAGQARTRFIFGQSNETGGWIFARQSMKGKTGTTDWLVHLRELPKRSQPVLGTLNMFMSQQHVALPRNASKEANAAASAVTGYAVYRWDGWLGGVFTWFLLPNGHEAPIDKAETTLPGLQYIVTKAERRFLARRHHKMT